jgi:Uma2 family endonuclease
MTATQTIARGYPAWAWLGEQKPPGVLAWEEDIDRYIRPLIHLDLPEEDGIPMETNWHRSAMNLLIDSVHALWRDRADYFAGGNMFIHYSLEQVLNRDFLGPDFFVVTDVDPTRPRGKWTVWEEGGRYPDVIMELSSPSTLTVDLTKKKRIYEGIFHTAEYFCYDPDARRLQGWRLAQTTYVDQPANAQGWLWSEVFQAWMGLWEGEFQRIAGLWPRLFAPDGTLVLTLAEAEAQRAEAEAQRAEAEAQRAETEAQRADRAEAENARLKALLAEHGIAVKA